MTFQPEHLGRYIPSAFVFVTFAAIGQAAAAAPVCELMWGTAGSGTGQFNSPVGIEIPDDPQGMDMIFVVDQGNNRIQSFTGEGYFVRSFGGPTLDSPTGIDSGSNHLIYVTDTGHDRVVAFLPYGGVSFMFGGLGAGAGQFDTPTGICVTPDDHIYVADKGNHRIQEFTLDGTFVRTWGSPGSGNEQFNAPMAVSCSSSGDLIYVADAGNSRIQVFDSQGVFVNTHHTDKTPSGLDVASPGDVYVAADYQMIHFSSALEELGRWGTSGTGTGQFSVAADAAVGNLCDVYVVDRDNNRIQKFSGGFTPVNPSTWGSLKQRFTAR